MTPEDRRRLAMFLGLVFGLVLVVGLASVTSVGVEPQPCPHSLTPGC